MNTEHQQTEDPQGEAPGTSEKPGHKLRSYVIGIGLAGILTLMSFWVAGTDTVYGPGVPVLLGVLAIAQMGVHLVFFLHISSAPDQANNFLSLAFGIFVVGLVVFGSMLIMANLNDQMMPMEKLMEMQR